MVPDPVPEPELQPTEQDRVPPQASLSRMTRGLRWVGAHYGPDRSISHAAAQQRPPAGAGDQPSSYA